MNERSKTESSAQKMRFSVLLLLTGIFMSLAGTGAWANSSTDRELRIPADQITPPPSPALRGKGQVVTGSFSHDGRTTRYRLALPTDTTTPAPVLIYFHGNNTGTQDGILDSFFPGIEAIAAERDLVPVVVTSPTTREGTEPGTRHWFDEDRPVMEAFITDELSVHFVPDYERIYFVGGSQGTCFLNGFLHDYPAYGGGFFAGCGCYPELDTQWDPPHAFRANFQILISATTEDFLYEDAWAGYGHYRYLAGMNTRSILDQPGPHCSAHWDSLDIALDWFTGKRDLPPEPLFPHWERVYKGDDIHGIVSDSQSVFWLLQATADGAELHFSEDFGTTWSLRIAMNGQPVDLDAVDGKLLLLMGDRYMWSSDGGATFSQDTSIQGGGGQLVAGDDGVVYRFLVNGGTRVEVSRDSGVSWQQIPDPEARAAFFLSGDSSKTAGAAIVVADQPFNNGDIVSVTDVQHEALVPLAPTPRGRIYDAASDGNRVWAFHYDTSTFGRYLYRSDNYGAEWVDIPVPPSLAMQPYLDLRVAGANAVIVTTPYGNDFLIADDVLEWQRFIGAADTQRFSIHLHSNANHLLSSNGRAAFRLVLREGQPANFADGFETGTLR